jgi:diaminopimelate epimerase
MKFTKLSATGNDFILFDNRNGQLTGKEEDFFRNICLRREGVGADGVILLEASDTADLKYRHFNADGCPAEMCGNGARSLCFYAASQSIAQPHMTFEIQGVLHEAWVSGDTVKLKIPPPGAIQTEMGIVTDENLEEGGFIILGVPHFILFTRTLASVDVMDIGRRYSSHAFFPNRTNVNLVQQIDYHTIQVRTYERGVENETLSCGTGSTASAIMTHLKRGALPPVRVLTYGGELTVNWEDVDDSIFLSGKASVIFEAELKAFL